MGAKRGVLFPSLIEGKSESSASDSLVACVCDDWEQLLVGLWGGVRTFHFGLTIHQVDPLYVWQGLAQLWSMTITEHDGNSF